MHFLNTEECLERCSIDISIKKCSSELASLTPPYTKFQRNTRLVQNLYTWPVKVQTSRTHLIKIFFYRTLPDWNKLPSAVFRKSYNLQMFKLRIKMFLLQYFVFWLACSVCFPRLCKHLLCQYWRKLCSGITIFYNNSQVR